MSVEINYKDSPVGIDDQVAINEFGAGTWIIHIAGINCNAAWPLVAKILLFDDVGLDASTLVSEIGAGKRRYSTLASGFVKTWSSILTDHPVKIQGPFSLVSHVGQNNSAHRHTLTWLAERVA